MKETGTWEKRGYGGCQEDRKRKEHGEDDTGGNEVIPASP